MCFWSRPELTAHLMDDAQTMPMDLFRRALLEIAPFAGSVCLAGGGEWLMDPLRDQRLETLGDFLRAHPHIVFNQISNGRLLTADALTFLRDVRSVDFAISIDSIDPFVYATIRRPGSVHPVLENIRSLRKSLGRLGVRRIGIGLNVVLLKRNLFGLPEVIRFAKQLGASVFADHAQGFGPPDLVNDSLFSVPSLSNRVLSACQQLADELWVPFSCPPPFATTEEEIRQYYDPRFRRMACPQLDSTGPMQIDANGDVRPCCQQLVLGNLLQTPFADLFHSPRYDEHRRAISAGRPLPPCDHCRFLRSAAPFLHEPSDYDLGFPPASPSASVDSDLERLGFGDWVNELQEPELRQLLGRKYTDRGRQILREGIDQRPIVTSTMTSLRRRLHRIAKERLWATTWRKRVIPDGTAFAETLRGLWRRTVARRP
jgi:MoaA/NifB/PqqE/SkfB family radical SAM enzyme